MHTKEASQKTQHAQSHRRNPRDFHETRTFQRPCLQDRDQRSKHTKDAKRLLHSATLFEQLLLQDIRESIHASAAQDRNVTRSHSAAAHSNGRDYRLVGHDQVADLSAELLVGTPESRASCTWDQDPSAHNSIIGVANPQQTPHRAPRTHRLKIIKTGVSDYHRVLNHHGSHLCFPDAAQIQERVSRDAAQHRSCRTRVSS